MKDEVTQENLRIVKDFFAAIGGGDKQALLALVAEDMEWIIPGEDWPLAGTHRGHTGLADVLQKASKEVEMTYPKPPEFVAHGERVFVVGVATGKIKATNKPFRDDWVFDITVRNGKLTKIREYIDTQALARASEMAASPLSLQKSPNDPSKTIHMATEESWANIVSLRNPDGSLDSFRLEETLPLLTDEQIKAIRPFAEEQEIPAGELVLRKGQTELDFLVVLKGAIEFSAADSSGKEPTRIILIPERSFASDLSLLTNTPLAADGRTIEATRILRVRHTDFRRLLSAEPDLATVILRAFVLRQSYKLRHGVGAVVLIGKAIDPDIQKLRTFLSRSDYPHKLIEPDAKDQTGMPMLASYEISPSDIPAAFIRKGCVLKKPSVFELASELGLVENLPSDHVYDLAIAGSGPAGLAAALSGASEGLDTIVFDALGPGGQAGSSSRIENYLGFPTGLSGQELASRAAVQALKFGVRLVSPRSVDRIVSAGEDFFELTLRDGARVLAKAVVLATGAVYRALDIPEYDRFIGHGIHHAATLLEAQLCVGEDIVIVGGGNSAGQAALYLSKTTAQVHLLVRQKDLLGTMSSYLIERLQASPKVRIYFDTDLTALTGRESLETVEWRNADGRSWTKPIRNIFVMIGAVPNTEWLKGCIELDSNGYVVTNPMSPFETSQPGVFAVGDVRAGSSKRVAAAVGEGSVVIQYVHHYLARADSVEATKKAV
ncbi:FAD-dependent oxidoreductase [Mucilaginibacter sp. BJC16-A38]|uniref:FAD-dependent oxidoreductase n=1 Tax=Mucilaginibacter phenanthrenivorans TaxID=1234842 RepID=UPI0021585C5D|nr:FAD-dependent oxidoreductase [Mucilaginibacter phenanthrenivorans]MCR8561590.1 FAD-dependent oxidoreductase [Mucilaginibacter phenanthrenivorans]